MTTPTATSTSPPTQVSTSPLKSIRRFCVTDCCAGSVLEVRLCPREVCALWPYRFGHNPKMARTGLTATYKVPPGMTARKAIHLRCRDCNPEPRRGRDCGCPDCVLHPIRYRRRFGAKSASQRHIQRGAALSRPGTKQGA